MHLKQLGDNMKRKRRPNFSPEFKLESARKQELAIRASVGAGSWELVKQVLLESFIICAAGFVFSLLLSSMLLNIMESVFFSDPFWYEFRLNAPAVFMGAVVTFFIWIGASATVAYKVKTTQPASMLAEAIRALVEVGRQHG